MLVKGTCLKRTMDAEIADKHLFGIMKPAIRRVLVTIALFGIVLAATIQAQASSGRWADNDQTSVRLISAIDAVGDSDTLQFGMEFQLQPGWKIYWRSPGDAGLPPVPDWSSSQNVASVDMDWPLPIRFELFGLQTFGYADTVVFPLSVKPQTPGEPVILSGSVSYLVCKEICIPYVSDIALDLPAGISEASAKSHAIGQFKAKVPRKPAQTGLRVLGSTVEAEDEKTVSLQVVVLDDQPLGDLELLVEGPEGSFFDAPVAMYNDDRSQAILLASGGGVTAEQIASAGATVTIAEDRQAIETTIRPDIGGVSLFATEPFETDGEAASVLVPVTIIGLALLGGLVLNLMPCVLPVLSLKLLSLIKHGGHDRRTVRISFLASAAGIISFFLVLGAGLAGLKTAGTTIGWGIQFQQPVFLAFMIAILTLFAANMFGLFEFTLPRFIADRAVATGSNDNLTGQFLTGAFVALLATPCTAPFLGTAVGFALSRGLLEILTIFFALGLGLAVPYFAVAAFPKVATMLPAPGPWMVKVKAIMGVALAGTAIWLITVMAAQSTLETALVVGVLSILAASVMGIRRLEGSRLARRSVPLAILLIIAAMAVPVVRDDAQDGPESPQVTDSLWVPFDEQAIPGLVASGKVVFVDVTADWCITCQFNKARVLNTEPVAGLLANTGVVAMKADWTNPDPAIAAYLQRYGRYGIPFNIVYGPTAPDGVPLPELLGEDAVLSAFEDAQPSLIANR